MVANHLCTLIKYSMQLIFDHTFGKQENQDLVVCRPMAIVDHDEEDDAIERGWLALDHPVNGKEVFYQSRSTRINLEAYRPRFATHQHDGQDIKFKTIDASEMVRLLGLPQIYRRYMQRKGFKTDYRPFEHYHKRDQFMVFYIGVADNIVAFTKQKRYAWGNPRYVDFDPLHSAGVESVIHANNMAIGQQCLDLEIKWASENRMPYYYLGSGYEQGSEYKASWRGFEWWTGSKWSTNKRQYRRLCRRDSRLSEFSALGNLSLIEDNS